MTWTHFMDMNSGGGCKEEPFEHIYIEAPQEKAELIFFNRYGHNPNRVSCTCCGEDYSISSNDSLAQLTGYYRGCRVLETPKDPETGRYLNDDPIIINHTYLEKGEDPPEGYKIGEGALYRTRGTYQTVEEYMMNNNIDIILNQDIKPSEQRGEVPDEGYVWV